jgi:hypothetical protein
LPQKKPHAPFGFGTGATTVSTSLSMALIGVGHLVGMAVGIAMLVGLIISWFVLVPGRPSMAASASAADIEPWWNSLPRKGALHRRRAPWRRGHLDAAPNHGSDHTRHLPPRLRQAGAPRRRSGQPGA